MLDRWSTLFRGSIGRRLISWDASLWATSSTACEGPHTIPESPTWSPTSSSWAWCTPRNRFLVFQHCWSISSPDPWLNDGSEISNSFATSSCSGSSRSPARLII
ncbi:hypothetical protein VTN96DRAFT_4524 [Rasamsonia emersonii]